MAGSSLLPRGAPGTTYFTIFFVFHFFPFEGCFFRPSLSLYMLLHLRFAQENRTRCKSACALALLPFASILLFPLAPLLRSPLPLPRLLLTHNFSFIVFFFFLWDICCHRLILFYFISFICGSLPFWFYFAAKKERKLPRPGIHLELSHLHSPSTSSSPLS